MQSLISDRCRVMGILNVTPDSFSDGGNFNALDAAVTRAFAIAEEGADILDVGGESTRPGAPAVPADEEWRRVAPLLEALAAAKYPIPVSLDTAKPAVARSALERGWATTVNDVGGLRDPAMVDVVREFACPVVLMHMFGEPRTMQQTYRYDDVVADLCAFFRRRLDETGLTDGVILDPGIGFGKGVGHNLEILRRLPEFKALGFPVLVGASRKSFIGTVLDLPVDDRLEGSLAVATLAAHQGADVVRAHDVRATRRAVRMAEAVKHGVPAR